MKTPMSQVSSTPDVLSYEAQSEDLLAWRGNDNTCFPLLSPITLYAGLLFSTNTMLIVRSALHAMIHPMNCCVNTSGKCT